MKLIGLIIAIVGWIFNLIYVFLMLPYSLYLHIKNTRWRKSPQVGDICFYKNILGTQTHCEIIDINLVGKVRIQSRCGIGTSYQWTTTKGLRKY